MIARNVMANPRSVERIFKAPEPHWVGDGFRVRGYFGAYPGLVQRMSPFLLLDYHEPHDYPPTSNERRGVGPHPHRGFETVTLAFAGSVAHHDSAGNGGVIGPGDVQWMTAGSGLLHREYHERAYAQHGGTMHMAQIWVNLPKASKMVAPRYQALTAEQMGRVVLPNGGGLVRVIAGELDGVKGPAKTFTSVTMLDVHLDPNGAVRIALPAAHNAAIVVMSGELTIGEDRAVANDLVLLRNDGSELSIATQGGAHVLVLAGEPIAEPVVQYGPFVMNTRREIEEAVMDFNAGKFGVLAE